MMSQIIHRNNVAVQLLRDGRCHDATEALKAALLHLQQYFRSACIEEGWAEYVAKNKEEVCRRLRDQILSKSNDSFEDFPPQATPIELPNNENREASDAYLVLFDRAFFLAPNESRERVISSVILYNCALASHISGVLLGNSQNLMNAMRLYQYACRILLEVVDTYDMNCTELLRLALYNNMGHVSFQLCHLADAEHYIKCLREEMGLSDSHPLGAALPTVTDDDYDFFCFNVTIRVEFMGAPAA